MSLRFVFGVLISALLTNWWIAYEICRSHLVMAKQPLWQYMFVNIPWQAWVTAFSVIGTVKIVALVFHRDRIARYGCLASFVVLFVWFTLAGLAYFEGGLVPGPRPTFLGPILILTAVSYEALFLVLSSVDVLDRVRFQRKQRGSDDILLVR